MADKKGPTKKQNVSDEYEHLTTQVAQLTEALQRERADAMNLRRRHEEEMANVRTRLKTTIVRDLKTSKTTTS
jgi:molecular chaperone GrpE (heat shock protein)